MMRNTLLLLCLLLLHFSAAAAEERNVVFFGDSLTAGLGIPQRESYPSRIQEKLKAENLAFKAVNAGVSGETSADGLARIDSQLKSAFPHVFVLALGANDGLRGLPAQEMEENLGKIIERVRETNPAAKILLLGVEMPVNLGPIYRARFRAVFPRLAEKYNVPLVPYMLEGVGGHRDMNLEDGIHPNAKGQERVAENIWSELKPLLKE